MDAVVEILKGLDYSPLYVSLKTGIVATIFSFFLGLFAARRVIKAGPKVKAIADGILTLPMVLPRIGTCKTDSCRVGDRSDGKIRRSVSCRDQDVCE